MKIKIGDIYRDTWNRDWQAISYNEKVGKWTMMLVQRPSHHYEFSPEFIGNNFKHIS